MVTPAFFRRGAGSQIHKLRHANFGIFRHPPTICHKFKITHQPPMCDITLWISIGYFSAFVMMCFVVSFLLNTARFPNDNDSENGQNGIKIGLPEYFYMWSQIFSTKGPDLLFWDQMCLIMNCLQKYNIALQKQPIHPYHNLSQNQKTPHPPWVTYDANGSFLQSKWA